MAFSIRKTPLIGFAMIVVAVGISFQFSFAANATKAGSYAARKIAPQVMSDLSRNRNASVVIFLTDQADVSAAMSITDRYARGWFVYNTLTRHAEVTQSDLRRFLTLHGIEFTSFWAANMIVATTDASTIEKIASRKDVARIDSNSPTRWIEPPEIANFGVTPFDPLAPLVVEWGVTNVNAPTVWGLGNTGTGIVVGGLDTGIRWTHNALRPKYRGWNGVSADHNYNWHDAIHSGGGICGANTTAPCDDNGHGTHTVGTMIGDDGTNQVGVAPGAKWVGCRNMDQGNGTPATYTECFQFMIAPTDSAGNNPNVALRPHVLNNSWGCPASEGCTTRAELATIVANVEAAGIFVSVSAGNSGSACSSVSSPPAIYAEAFSVGAINSTNTIASFSSRGPSTFYSPNLLKPNISAPGVSVRSATNANDSSFGTSSGTSMASPHVASVVALLWSARPSLIGNIALTRSVLQSTANPSVIVSPTQTCGGIASTQIPNNSFGYGRIDALAAVTAPSAASVSVSGTTMTADGRGIRDAIVTLTGPNTSPLTARTNALGYFRFDNVIAGETYVISVASKRYAFTPRTLSVVDEIADLVLTAN